MQAGLSVYVHYVVRLVSSGAVCCVAVQEFTLTPTQYGVPYSRPR